MKQKLLALVCALALVVSLAGCVISTPDTVGSLGDYEISSGEAVTPMRSPLCN